MANQDNHDQEERDRDERQTASGSGDDRDMIASLQEQRNDFEEKWKRAIADYQNLEKRLEKERTQVLRIANIMLINKFLEVLDDLERAHDHRDDDEGLEMVIRQFKSVLQSEGVIEMEIEGEEFDPHKMECIETVSREDEDEEIVVEVVKKGYIYQDGQNFEKVVRPAEVVVNKIGE